jgi:hypothetical protein
MAEGQPVKTPEERVFNVPSSPETCIQEWIKFATAIEATIL